MTPIEKYLSTRDKRCAAYEGHAPITSIYQALMKNGFVLVGGIANCGAGKANPSWTYFCAWEECVRKINKSGAHKILVEPIKQKNAWATRNGGWASENKYTLVAVLPEDK